MIPLAPLTALLVGSVSSGGSIYVLVRTVRDATNHSASTTTTIFGTIFGTVLLAIGAGYLRSAYAARRRGAGWLDVGSQ